MANATRYLINYLFGKFGLVILDADTKPFKDCFSAIAKEELEDNITHKKVSETIHYLSEKKLISKPQVAPREINLFYIKDNIRERIEQKDEKYFLVNKSLPWTGKEMMQELALYPEHFSPNVLLRPLFQEKILPNIAYVGGGAELAYWLELKRLFEHFNIHMPALVLRHSALIIDNVSRSKMNKLNIAVNDIFKTEEELIRNFVKSKNNDNISLDEERQKLELFFHALAEKIVPMDATLKTAVEAELQKTLNGLKNIESKTQRALKLRHENEVNQIIKLKQKLFPNNILQERYENIFAYILKFGFNFIDELKLQLNSFESEFSVLEVEMK
jgi:bacillithiol biosynthesis cysteine-adding enzyme BshC